MNSVYQAYFKTGKHFIVALSYKNFGVVLSYFALSLNMRNLVSRSIIVERQPRSEKKEKMFREGLRDAELPWYVA